MTRMEENATNLHPAVSHIALFSTQSRIRVIRVIRG